MNTLPFALNENENLLHAEEIQIIPAHRAPQPGEFWLTSQRVIGRWVESGLLRAASQHELIIALEDIVETRTPGGPLVQVIAKDGARLSLQSFRPRLLQQRIVEAVQKLQSPTKLLPPYRATSGTECPRCGCRFEVDHRFCAQCGQYLRTHSAYCRRCDRQYPLQHRYCVRCGDELLFA